MPDPITPERIAAIEADLRIVRRLNLDGYETAQRMTDATEALLAEVKRLKEAVYLTAIVAVKEAALLCQREALDFWLMGGHEDEARFGEQLAAMIRKLEPLSMPDYWALVGQGKPEEGKIYMVQMENGERRRAMYDPCPGSPDLVWALEKEGAYVTPTHWHQLPEPPAEVKP